MKSIIDEHVKEIELRYNQDSEQHIKMLGEMNKTMEIYRECSIPSIKKAR